MATKTKRYSAAERARILSAAEKQGLNGVQAAKKFGISTLTYYTWKKRAAGTPRRASDRRVGSQTSLDALLRSRLRHRLEQLLPVVLREEVEACVQQALGTSGPRRVRAKA